jgi:hypothetical protein
MCCAKSDYAKACLQIEIAARQSFLAVRVFVSGFSQ